MASAASKATALAGNLRTRILSALVLGPAVLVCAYVGGAVFHLLVGVGAVLAMAEWSAIVAPKLGQRLRLVLLIAVAAVAVADLLLGPGAALAVVAAALPTARMLLAATARPWWLTLGIAYVGVPAVALTAIRDLSDHGFGRLVFLLLVVWATDIGAYATGRAIGGPRLAPRISPNKTWAGLAGGMVAAALFGAGSAPWWGAGMVGAALLGALLAVVEQAGDLFESAVKRRYSVKDSGRLIPGHGGLLDRVDGLIAAAPVFVLVQLVLGTHLSWW